MTWKRRERDDSFHLCIAQFGAALERLACAYESRRDLLQEVHTALWRSMGVFDERCSLRTWTFRVAHNTAASHIARSMRHSAHEWVTLETIEDVAGDQNNEDLTNKRLVIDRVAALIRRLRPLDRQMFLLYLEGFRRCLDWRDHRDLAGKCHHQDSPHQTHFNPTVPRRGTQQ